MSFLDRIAACNRHALSHFRPFQIGAQQLGWVRRERVDRLLAMPAIFVPQGEGIALAPRHESFAERSAALSDAVDALAADGLIPARRGEDFSVMTEWGQPALCRLDRSAVTSFGVRAFGIHLNGFVEGPDGLRMWIGHRAADRQVAPGKLDNMVAGGQPHGLTLQENLVKECAEEAGIGRDLALTARPVGALSYTMEVDRGLKRDVHFVYDLRLPPDFEPKNQDGEVERFSLLPIEEVAARVRDSDDFKFNVGPVIIDFLIRHGLLTPDEPDYLAITRGLRQ